MSTVHKIPVFLKIIAFFFLLLNLILISIGGVLYEHFNPKGDKAGDALEGILSPSPEEDKRLALAQKPSEILERELTGKLLIEGWEDIVAAYSTPKHDRKNRKMWIFIDGHIVRKLPFDTWDQQRSDTLYLPEGLYRLEVLEVPQSPGYPVGNTRDLSTHQGIIWVETIRITNGESLRSPLVQKFAAVSRINDPIEIRLRGSDDFIVYWNHWDRSGNNYLQDQIPFKGFLFLPKLDFSQPMMLPLTDAIDDERVQAYSRSVENSIRGLKEDPLVVALLNASAQPPPSHRIMVDFPNTRYGRQEIYVPYGDLGGPRQVDGDLVRRLYQWHEKVAWSNVTDLRGLLTPV